MIRPARTEDLPSLLLLLKQLFSIEKDFIYDAEKQLRGLKLLLQADYGQILVAEADGMMVGMVSGQLLISTAEGGAALVVEDVVVAPSHQGNNIGSALLQAIGAWGHSRGAARMQLLADTKNSQALTFYDKAGWQRTQLTCLRKYHLG